MKNISNIINILLITLYIPSIYAQNSPPSVVLPAEKNTSCTIPSDVNVAHIPTKNWYTGANTLKTAQEILDTIVTGASDTIRFFERQFSDDSAEESTVNEEKIPSSILEQVAYSQFILTKIILENPHSFVFHEFSTQIYDLRYLNTFKKPEASFPEEGDVNQTPDKDTNNPEYLFQLVKQQFPNGIPNEYTSLNEAQKYTLAIVGGAHTLLFIGQLPIIFPSISNKDYTKVYLSGCKSNYNMLRICLSESTQASKVYRAEKLAQAVNHFLEDHSSVASHRSTLAILVYNDELDLQNYFPDKSFYKIPDSCLSIENK